MYPSFPNSSGAFLLLPLQVSLLGFTSPAVSATNHFYNVFAGIGGPVRFLREGRLLWPLALIVMLKGSVAQIEYVWCRLSAVDTIMLILLGIRLCVTIIISSKPVWATRPRKNIARSERPCSLQNNLETLAPHQRFSYVQLPVPSVVHEVGDRGKQLEALPATDFIFIAYFWGTITLRTGLFLLSLILIEQFTAR